MTESVYHRFQRQEVKFSNESGEKRCYVSLVTKQHKQLNWERGDYAMPVGLLLRRLSQIGASKDYASFYLIMTLAVTPVIIQ